MVSAGNFSQKDADRRKFSTARLSWRLPQVAAQLVEQVIAETNGWSLLLADRMFSCPLFSNSRCPRCGLDASASSGVFGALQHDPVTRRSRNVGTAAAEALTHAMVREHQPVVDQESADALATLLRSQPGRGIRGTETVSWSAG